LRGEPLSPSRPLHEAPVAADVVNELGLPPAAVVGAASRFTEANLYPLRYANAYTGGEMGEAAIESDGTDVFVIYDGKRIAKRGHPDTPQTGTWVSIERGYTVRDRGYPQELVVEYEGKVVSR
jgi:hypothetical protein